MWVVGTGVFRSTPTQRPDFRCHIRFKALVTLLPFITPRNIAIWKSTLLSPRAVTEVVLARDWKPIVHTNWSAFYEQFGGQSSYLTNTELNVKSLRIKYVISAPPPPPPALTTLKKKKKKKKKERKKKTLIILYNYMHILIEWMNENLYIAHKKLPHKTLRVHSARYTQCIHVSSRKLKLPKYMHSYQKVQTAPTHPPLPKSGTIHNS